MKKATTSRQIQYGLFGFLLTYYYFIVYLMEDMKKTDKKTIYLIVNGDYVEYCTEDKSEALEEYKSRLANNTDLKIDILKAPKSRTQYIRFGDFYFHVEKDGQVEALDFEEWNNEGENVEHYQPQALADYLKGYTFIDKNEIAGAVADYFESIRKEQASWGDLADYEEIADRYIYENKLFVEEKEEDYYLPF